MEINAKDFMKFLFSVVSLFVCSLLLMLYTHKILGFAVRLFLRYCILPSTTRIHIGGIFLAPLSCRLFIQDFFYQDENLSLRIMDGYVSFCFWDSWWEDPSWTTVKDFMFTDDLKGARCRVKLKLNWVSGVIVEVLREERAVRVRLDDSGGERAGASPFVNLDADTHFVEVSPMEVSAVSGNTTPAVGNVGHRGRSSDSSEFEFVSWPDARERSSLGISSARFDPVFSPAEQSNAPSDNIPAHQGTDDDEADNNNDTSTVGLFNIDAVQIPQSRGKIRVHLNGMGLCLYNATWNYNNLGEAQTSTTHLDEESHRSSLQGWALRSILNRLGQEGDRSQAGGDEELRRMSYGNPNERQKYSAEVRSKALEEQQRLKSARNRVQRLFDFIGAVEVELYGSYVDIGGAGAAHPYFLHFDFKRGECHSYLTMDGVPSIDLYRFVTEMTLEDVHARWCPMKKEKENKNVPMYQEKKNAWRESFMLMLKGTTANDTQSSVPDEVSMLIRNYGMLLNGKEKSIIHAVFYRDVANVYAGEEVSREAELPRTGLELLIDAPELCYGPWSHYSLMKLKEFFFPLTYKPLESLKFELGERRPLAGFELFVEFLRDTCLTVPFKRKSPAPSPPFGIRDSGHKGVILITLGRESQYIQKPQFLLQTEKKQWFESLFSGKNVSLATNGIQDESTLLARMRTIELFIDREDQRVYTGRKLWNVLPSFGELEVWWYMDYIAFFMDLLTDWQFVPEMYHGVPLTTEIYNTYDRFVKEFIPNVKRFEVFFTAASVLHVNCNPQNVIFSEDLNDDSLNSFLNIRVGDTGHFFMTLPSDTYLLSASTEVQRPFQLTLRNMEACLSLPQTHPLFKLVDAAEPFVRLDELRLTGSQTVYIPNQTVPQDKTPVDPATGRTKLLNHLDLDLQLIGLRGFVMPPHIRALIEAAGNLFKGSVCVIRPDELFWPLSKIQPKLDAPRNVRQKFNEYLQREEPPSNMQELSLHLSVLDIDLTLRSSRGTSPKMNLCSAKFNFSLIKQCALNDLSVAATPIIGRFFDQDGEGLMDGLFFCTADITASMIRRFGPMPLQALFHSVANVMLGGITFELTVELVAMLTQLLNTFMEQFPLCDARLLRETEIAKTRAAFSAHHLMPRSGRAQQKSSETFPTEYGTVPLRHLQSESCKLRTERDTPKEITDARAALERILARDGTALKVPFSELVPEEMAVGFNKYLETIEKAEDEAKDHAVVTILASLERVMGCVRVGPDGYVELQLRGGVQLASSTVNDLNSNSRLSAAVRDIALRGFCRLDVHEDAKPSEDFAEVFHLATSLRVRNCTAYPFDQGLEHHLENQRRFLAENDVDHLFTCEFPPTPRIPPEVSVTTKPQRAIGGTPPGHIGLTGEDGTKPQGDQTMAGNSSQATHYFAQTIFALQQEDTSSPAMADSAPDLSGDVAAMLSSPGSLRENNNMTSQQYLTCLSAASEKEVDEESEEMECTGSGSSERLDDVNARSSADSSPSLVQETGTADSLVMRPVEPFTSFLRPFFLHSQADDEVTLLKYTAAAATRLAKDGLRDFTRFHAPLPSTVFFASMSPHRAPKFCMSQAMLNATLGAADDEESEVWALRQTDNRKRSREGSTSKHLHLEAVAPLTVLVTRPFIEKLFFEAEARFFKQVHYYQFFPVVPAPEHALLRDTSVEWENNDLDNDVSRTEAQLQKQQRRAIHRRELSRSRVHQKRWLSEVKVTSVILPCVEVKVLTELPVPQENVAPGVEGQGVYTTTLGVRSFKFVMQHTLPPAHAAMLVEERALSASVTLSSLAVITQVEYEPAVREGNLQVKVPGIAYDEEKDTLAVVYFTSFCGRGKRDNTHGIGSGTCHVSVDTVALHLTRDFLFFVHSVKVMLQQLCDLRQLVQRESASLPFPLPADSLMLLHRRGESVRDIVFPRQSQSTHASLNSLEEYGIEASINVQGVGAVNTFHVELIDVYREGRYLRVNTEASSVIEVRSPSAKFLARVPIRPMGEGAAPYIEELNCMRLFASATLGTSLPHQKMQTGRLLLRSRRDAEVQFIGEVNAVLVKCYPSVLRILGTAKEAAAVAVARAAECDSELPPPLFVPVSGSSGPLDAQTSGCGLGVVFKGSCIMRQLDASFLHSELNFMQFKVANLTGCGESRTECISSRECVETDVFTGAISERLRERLHVLAQRARSRAPKGHYAAPPSVTPQLHLKKTVSFFAESMSLQYVADVIVPASLANTLRSSAGSVEEHEESRVFAAAAKHLAVGMHHADKNCISTSDSGPKDASEKKSAGAPEGVQMNLQVDIGKMHFLLPYRPVATETVQAQLHQWLQGWIEAKEILQAMRPVSHVKMDDTRPSLLSPQQKKIHASCCAVQLREIKVKMGLPQGINTDLNIPLASAFFNASSDKRLNFKAHLHPFMLASESPSAGRYTVEFPSVYVIYAKDELVRTGTCMMETVEITVSSSIMSHLILFSDRIVNLCAAVSKSFHAGGKAAAEEEGDREVAPQQPPSSAATTSPGWRSRFLFLLEGFCVSYLTSMTNLRFSVRKLSALTGISCTGSYRITSLMVSVATAQIALVDRDDYDQLQTMLRQATTVSQSDASVPSTKVAMLPPNSISMVSEDSMRLVRPLGGFIWGLVETSFTLSSGRRDTNEVRAAIENIFAASQGPSVDMHELEKLGNTATRWKLSIISPLIIARVGLVPLLQQSIDETKEVAGKMRFASEREGRLFRRQLSKHAAYHRLARVQKQMEAQMEQTQRQNMRRLQALTAQVLPQGAAAFQARSPYTSKPKVECGSVAEGNLFSTESDNKLFATVTNFLVVMPFGDAAYRSIIEGKQDMYHSGRGATALNRKHFIPTMALKLRVEKSTFACRLLKSQSWAPAMLPPWEKSTFAGFFGASEQETSSTVTFTARYMLDDANLYCSDGSPLDSDLPLTELLCRTHIFGGLGTFTGLSREECRNSFSKVFIGSIDAPIHVNKTGNTVTVGAVVDMSAPKICISTRFVSDLSQLTQEVPSVSLRDIFGPHTVSKATCHGATLTSHHSPRQFSVGEATGLTEIDGKERHADPSNPQGGSQAVSTGLTLYQFDLTVRVERGEVKVYSLQRDAPFGVPGASPTADGLTSNRTRSFRRRVKFAPEALDKGNMGSDSSDGATAVYPMAELLTFPTPDITAMVLATVSDSTTFEQELIVRVEMRAGPIEIGPSIMLLAEEIEVWVSMQGRSSSERGAKILGLVKEWERGIAARGLALHSSVADVALPVPRGFAEAVAQIQSMPNGLIALQRQRQQRQSRHFDSTPPECQNFSVAGPTGLGGCKKNIFASVHICITGLRFVLTTKPVSTVTLALFQDERGGSLDFFVKRMLGSTPTVSFTLCVRRTRLECQAKLEVKSFEMFLPDVVICASLRRRQHAWELLNVYVHTPLDVASGVDVEMTVRAPHVAQLFIVQELWQRTLLESMHSIRQMFTRSANIIQENVRKSAVIRRHIEAMRKDHVDEALMLLVTASHMKLRLELSSGNAQQVTLGGVSLIMLRTQSAERTCRKTCFDAAVRSFLMRSEGVLAGVANVDGVLLKGFLIANAEGAGALVRSPSGRTFRNILCVQKLHAGFKERQLKDVFECQVTELCLASMDGVGEKNSTTVEAALSLYKSNVFVTPSTVPVILNTVSSVGEIVATQREVSGSLLRDSGVQAARTPSSVQLKEVSCGMELLLDPRRTIAGGEIPPPVLDTEAPNSGDDNSVSWETRSGSKSIIGVGEAERGLIPFMGNPLTRIPCGALTVKLEQTTLRLGTASAGGSSSGSLVASFPRATLSFAECPSEEDAAVKKVLEIRTENVELFRPGAVKVLILGFRGANRFEFYSRQVIGEGEVGFMLTLLQSNPWTGNPRFQDFQEMLQLVRSFTMKSHAKVFHQFGVLSRDWPAEVTTSVPLDAEANGAASPAEKTERHNADDQPADKRSLRALRPVTFSPQLRFGGDVAVNVDVILNWLGVSEKMLPQILHMRACDRLEAFLDRLAERANTQRQSSGTSTHTRMRKQKE
ncbi:hypothetical protein TraAM80_05804 [Trypanosoma rangeli]|uniref:Transmembrane protein n=1 Tax=Trypanosoma rangeli TaxID=5698 RepID=A0A3R7NJC7_TRYRA|nr:uncharacterized protein TraAM80_05804 [Trypanosoma rangeli]RNF03455.1 hypothetical protein TraAM80_05804 [Trypanosoma rangeli]|eukprot:RNF03455.1 hypothetical protein TraAM80_05804 [Trypanosoma rangeli]